MKKNKVLVAKILVIFLVILIVAVSLVVLVHDLEKPNQVFRDSFAAFVKDYEDTTKLMEIDLYKLFDGKVSVKANTSVTYSGLNDTKYNKYSELLNSKMITSIKYNKGEDYLIGSHQFVDLGEEYSIDYYENGNDMYIKKNDEVYKHLKLSSFNYKAFDVKAIKSFGYTISKVVKDSSNSKTIERSKKDITVNNNNYKTTVYSYNFNGKEMDSIINNFVNEINSNNELAKYTSRVANDDLKNYINRMLGKEESFSFNIYLMEDGTPIKCELKSPNKTYMSYSYKSEYHELLLNDIKYVFTSGDGSYSLTISKDKDVTYISYSKSNAANSLSIKKSANDKEIFDGSCSYTLIPGESNVVTFDYSISINIPNGSSSVVIMPKGKALVSSNASIENIKIKDDYKDLNSKTTFVDILDDILENANTYMEQKKIADATEVAPVLN